MDEAAVTEIRNCHVRPRRCNPGNRAEAARCPGFCPFGVAVGWAKWTIQQADLMGTLRIAHPTDLIFI